MKINRFSAENKHVGYENDLSIWQTTISEAEKKIISEFNKPLNEKIIFARTKKSLKIVSVSHVCLFCAHFISANAQCKMMSLFHFYFSVYNYYITSNHVVLSFSLILLRLCFIPVCLSISLWLYFLSFCFRQLNP